MLIDPRRLLARLGQPRSRRAEVAALRRRFVAAREPGEHEPELRALAREMLTLRRELAALVEGVTSCGKCAAAYPAPHGHFAGGYCCGARTDEIFRDDEIEALRLAGTTPRRLVLPRGDHAGCAFRGPRGCSLAADDRPGVCAHFVCRELERELRVRELWPRARELRTRLVAAKTRFSRLMG